MLGNAEFSASPLGLELRKLTRNARTNRASNTPDPKKASGSRRSIRAGTHLALRADDTRREVPSGTLVSDPRGGERHVRCSVAHHAGEVSAAALCDILIAGVHMNTTRIVAVVAPIVGSGLALQGASS